MLKGIAEQSKKFQEKLLCCTSRQVKQPIDYQQGFNKEKLFHGLDII